MEVPFYNIQSERIETMRSEIIVMNEARNVSLTCYIQDVGGEYFFTKRPAMIVIPGGGYAMCSDREGDPVAMAYLRAGYHAFVLRYTLKDKGLWPAPLLDYEAAYEILESHSEDWGIDMDHIAVVGFSAGGHLAASIATMAEHRPQAAVLVYPAILKELLDACAAGLPSPAEYVDKNTCPCFITATRTDEAVPTMNELAFEQALVEHGILYESHMYSFGPHGFTTGEPWIQDNICERVPHWVDESISWLGEVMGRLMRNGFTKPMYPGRINCDSDKMLSVFCTFGHLQKQEEEVQKLMKPVYDAIDALAAVRGFAKDLLLVVIQGTTLQSLMKTLQIPDEKIQEIDAELQKIENRKD